MKWRIFSTLLGCLGNRVEADVPEGDRHEDREYARQTATPEGAVSEIGGQISDLATGDARHDEEHGTEQKSARQHDLYA